jgi:hypothetical protein
VAGFVDGGVVHVEGCEDAVVYELREGHM